MKRALLKAVLDANRERRAVAVITSIANGEQRLVAKENLGSDPLGAVLEEAFRFDQSGLLGGEFLHVHNPPLRLVNYCCISLEYPLFFKNADPTQARRS